jgi:hypothetical protein
VVDVEHVHNAGLFVNAVDDAVSPAPRAMTADQWAKERFAYPARAQGQGSFAEFKNRCRYGLRQPFGDGAARGSLEPYLIALGLIALAGHVPL